MIKPELDRLFKKFLHTFNLDNYPTSNLLKTLILEESERTDDEVIQCLEFIYSHLVNKFQGDLAETYAAELCHALERQWKADGKLPPDAIYVYGDIMEKSQTSTGMERGDAWRKGADGLFVMEEPVSNIPAEPITQNNTSNLNILAVVEIKSYAMSYRKASAQIKKHLSRLSHGLKIGKREWPSERLFFMSYNAESRTWKRTFVLETKMPDIIHLLIKPSPAKKNRQKRYLVQTCCHQYMRKYCLIRRVSLRLMRTCSPCVTLSGLAHRCLRSILILGPI